MNKDLISAVTILLLYILCCSDTSIWEPAAAAPGMQLLVAAKKAVAQELIPGTPTTKSKKLKKQSFWQRLKFWKRGKVKTSKSKKKTFRKAAPGLGKWVLAFLVVLILGWVLLFLVLFLTFLLLFGGLAVLGTISLFLGLFGIFLLLRKVWVKMMGLDKLQTAKPEEHAEDIQGKPNRPPESVGGDVPRYQSLELDNAQITLCIYNTQSGSTPVRIRMDGKELSRHFGPANDPRCFDLRLLENAKNEIHFEAPAQEPNQKELLRIVVEDGDIAREIYVRKGGTLELILK